MVYDRVDVLMGRVRGYMLGGSFFNYVSPCI